MDKEEVRATFTGHISSTEDADILLDACLQGSFPQMPRRLRLSEREALIKSGSIFIYDERLLNMRRWMDGRAWSRRRSSGSFYLYRELKNGKGSPPKEAGLVRKMTSLTRNGTSYRLISYFTDDDVQSGLLTTPTSNILSEGAYNYQSFQLDGSWIHDLTKSVSALEALEWNTIQPWLNQNIDFQSFGEMGFDMVFQ